MQTVGPYALHRKLSTCELGEVWAARDSAERPFTVAVLAPAAAEGGWREAFAAAANTLARSDGLPITGANHTGPVPWVACAAEQGAGAAHVFLALGQQLTPVGEPPTGAGPQGVRPPAGAAPATRAAGVGPATDPPTGRPGGGASPAPADGSRAPMATALSAGPATDGSAPPTGAPRPPGPTSPAPQPPAPPRTASTPQQALPALPRQPRTRWCQYPHPPVMPRPAPAGYPAYPPVAARGRGRTGWWLALVALVALVAAAVGAVGGLACSQVGPAPRPDHRRRHGHADPERRPGAAGHPAAPAGGVEPPIGGGWPAAAPTFAGTDPTREITGLAGVDFSFRGAHRLELHRGRPHQRFGALPVRHPGRRRVDHRWRPGRPAVPPALHRRTPHRAASAGGGMGVAVGTQRRVHHLGRDRPGGRCAPLRAGLPLLLAQRARRTRSTGSWCSG